MLHSLFRTGLAMGLLGLWLVPGAASAQDRRVRHVQDDAHLFSKEAIGEANAIITKIHDKHHKDLFIETVKEGPENDHAKWSRERFNEYKIDGVYVVFCKQPKFFRIEVGNKTRSEGYFTDANIHELEKIVKSKQSADEMLERIAKYTLDTMNRQAPAAAPVQPKGQPKQRPAPVEEPAPAPAPGPVIDRGGEQPAAHSGWLAMILPVVCVIVGGIVVLWVIFALIRAMTGMGGGGYGYGGGGGMMGGGGGFLTGMLGGLFGAMAGMWIYNSFFGGHATYGADGNVNWGGGNQGSSSDGGDTDTGGSGGGDNWGGGNDDGGADAGGGKGDDGDANKGDDGGGGGDWGDDAGGGGDAGGGDAGGGGDWGGGGGGDAGGDWGGGGDAGGGGGGDFGGGGGGCGGGGGGDW